MGLWKVGTSWISRKGGILKNGYELDLEKGGGGGGGGISAPLTNYDKSVSYKKGFKVAC